MKALNNIVIYIFSVVSLIILSICLSWKFDCLLPFLIRIFLIGLVILLTNKISNRNSIINIIGFIGIILLLFSNYNTEKIFLGNVISERYMGEDAGYYDLKLYKNNKYKMTYGSAIGGDSKNYIGKFIIINNNYNINFIFFKIFLYTIIYLNCQRSFYEKYI